MVSEVVTIARAVLVLAWLLLLAHSYSRPTAQRCYSGGGSIDYSGRHCVYQTAHQLRSVPLHEQEAQVATAGLLGTLAWLGLSLLARRRLSPSLRRRIQIAELLGYAVIVGVAMWWAALTGAILGSVTVVA